MASDRRPGLTVVAVIVALLCCAAPLLITAGVVASVGVLLRSLLIVAVAVGLVGWAVWRVAGAARRSGRVSVDRDDPRV